MRWKGGKLDLPDDGWTSSPNASAEQPLGSIRWDLGELPVELPPEALEAGAVERVGRVRLTLVEEGVVRLDKRRVPLELTAL